MDKFNDSFEEDFDEDKPLTDNNEYDGVIYERSQDTKPISKTRAEDRRDLINRLAEPNNRRVTSKQDYRPLLLAIGLCAIIIIIATFVIVYNIVNPRLKPRKPTENTKIEENISDDDEIKNISDIVPGVTVEGVIEKIDSYDSSIVFTSLEDNKSYVVKIKGSTFLKDKNNNEIMLNDFSKGEAVTFVYDNTDRLAYVMKSSGGFEVENANIEVDSDRKLIIDTNNKDYVYYYNDKLSTNYKEATVDISTITKDDKVTLRGYKDTVYYIDVTQGHGTLEIVNKDKIRNGTIDIDKSIVAKPLGEVSSLILEEGNHNVVIKGDNCEIFIKDIEIKGNEAYSLDLAEVQIKQGVLLLKTNVSDYLLYVNDKIELSREPLILDYGAYTIKVEKEGYKSYENQIVLDKSQYTLDIELEKNIPMGKLTVNTTPEYADVYVDNAKVGISPLTVQVAQGNHNLTVKKEGYKDITFNGIQITNIESQYNVTLQQEVPPSTSETQTE